MIKHCDFCGNRLSILFEVDDDMWCDLSTEKWTCSHCHVSFVYTTEWHIRNEFWIVRERNQDGSSARSIVIRVNFASLLKEYYYQHKFKKASFIIEIFEYVQGSSVAKILYRGNEFMDVTPSNAEQKLRTILTFS
jgi:hypothetical protein